MATKKTDRVELMLEALEGITKSMRNDDEDSASEIAFRTLAKIAHRDGDSNLNYEFSTLADMFAHIDDEDDDEKFFSMFIDDEDMIRVRKERSKK